MKYFSIIQAYDNLEQFNSPRKIRKTINLMKLTHQVCTWAQAQQLYNLGAKQDAIFYFDPGGFLEVNSWGSTEENPVNGPYAWAAYTVSELGRLFPAATIEQCYSSGQNSDGTWYCQDAKGKTFTAKHEAWARAEMLISLLTPEQQPSVDTE